MDQILKSINKKFRQSFFFLFLSIINQCNDPISTALKKRQIGLITKIKDFHFIFDKEFPFPNSFIYQFTKTVPGTQCLFLFSDIDYLLPYHYCINLWNVNLFQTKLNLWANFLKFKMKSKQFCFFSSTSNSAKMFILKTYLFINLLERFPRKILTIESEN